MLRESLVQIGKWQLRGDATLSAGHESRRLTPKAYDLLVYLTERPGRLVTNEELVDALWSHGYVSDGSVYKLMSKLRHAFGDNAKSPIC